MNGLVEDGLLLMCCSNVASAGKGGIAGRITGTTMLERREDAVVFRLERKEWRWWLVGRVLRADLLSEEVVVQG